MFLWSTAAYPLGAFPSLSLRGLFRAFPSFKRRNVPLGLKKVSRRCWVGLWARLQEVGAKSLAEAELDVAIEGEGEEGNRILSGTEENIIVVEK